MDELEQRRRPGLVGGCFWRVGMGIVALVLGVVTLLIATRWRKKIVFAVLAVLWVGGIGAYVYASYGAQRAMAAAERRTTRAVIEVQGPVG